MWRNSAKLDKERVGMVEDHKLGDKVTLSRLFAHISFMFAITQPQKIKIMTMTNEGRGKGKGKKYSICWTLQNYRPSPVLTIKQRSSICEPDKDKQGGHAFKSEGSDKKSHE